MKEQISEIITLLNITYIKILYYKVICEVKNVQGICLPECTSK